MVVAGPRPSGLKRQGGSGLSHRGMGKDVKPAIRKLRSAAGTEQYYRLDMNKSEVQAKVLLITTNAQLNQLFEELT